MKNKKPTTQKPETRPMLIRLPLDLRRALKLRAVDEDRSVSEIILEAIREKIKTE